MAGRKRWVIHNLEHGIQYVDLSGWKFFNRYMHDELLDFPSFVYRGHSSATWVLEPLLDRILRTRGRVKSATARARHLAAFQHAVRGRRGNNPPEIRSEDEWWALGQHQGLATPLLDWTKSPYVAAFFAFETLPQAGEEICSLYAIDSNSFEAKSQEIRKQNPEDDRPFAVKFIDPLSDENVRLVSQRALFTRAPDGVHVEEWVRSVFPAAHDSVVFIKISIPLKDRILALRDLNKMNINRLSLFPDLSGASLFCNHGLVIEGY